MTRYKVLFINPIIKPKDPPYNIPLGLAHLAAVVEDQGHDVAIFDNNAYKLEMDKLIDQIRDIPWDLIGIGSLVTTYPYQKELFKKLREAFPESTLVAGGGLATSIQDELLEWIPELDIVSIGEGERTIAQILDNLSERTWENVRGICYRKNRNTFKTEPQFLLTEEELSNLPFPKFDLLPLEEVYFNHSGIPLSPEAMVCKRRISIQASRGCPFKCNFCIDLPSGKPRNMKYSEDDTYHNISSCKNSMRYLNPKRVVELIKYLRLKYAIDFITFADENFTVNRNKVLEFCDEMEKQGLVGISPPIYFSTTSHVNAMDPEMLERLYSVGCRVLDIGMESMNDYILQKSIQKSSSSVKNKKGFDTCIKSGIYPVTNFLIGHPEESAQSVYDTTKFLVENEIECGPFFITPYPKTGLFDRCKKLILEKFGSLENYVIECTKDVSRGFVVNLTQYNDAELLGLRQMVMNHDLKGIIEFASQKNEEIVP